MEILEILTTTVSIMLVSTKLFLLMTRTSLADQHDPNAPTYTTAQFLQISNDYFAEKLVTPMSRDMQQQYFRSSMHVTTMVKQVDSQATEPVTDDKNNQAQYEENDLEPKLTLVVDNDWNEPA